jgi:TetR/AcrR family transcriptional repressor of mexJK operon
MITEPVTSVPSRSARETKREAFVAAARDAFLTHGYAATAMSTIAAKVGGSKTTLWSYFPSKEELFAAVVDEQVERYGQALEDSLSPELPLREALYGFGIAMMGIVLTPDIIDLHRLVVGEAGRFPEMGTLFFERGPKRGKAKLSAYLTAAMTSGRVYPSDPERLARQFAYMCQSNCHQARLMGLTAQTSPQELAADVEAAVETFVRAWGIAVRDASPHS